MLRQPLRDTATPNASRMRNRRVENGVKNPRSKSSARRKMATSGIENQPRKRTLTKSKSLNSKSRVKVLLGGMLDRFQPKTPTVSSSRGSSSSFQMEALLATQQQQPKKEPPCVAENVRHDASSTTALTEAESPLLDESFVVRLMEPVASQLPTEEDISAKNRKEKERVESATLLQAQLRGYRQRYAYKMLILRKKLEQIQFNKERQLTKLSQRTKAQKRRAKSVVEFHDPYEKVARRLQRVARIIPYLFREAQAKLQENAQMANSLEHVQELEESHMNVQKLAHSYLESLEDIDGIWEALKVQWMTGKKSRPRRRFGSDGKIIRQRSAVILNQYNTHDDDLPVHDNNCIPPSPMARQASDDDNEHTNLFVNLFVQACGHEIYSTEEDVDESVEHIQELVGNTVWN